MRADEMVKAVETASTENGSFPGSLRRATIDRGARRSWPGREGASAIPARSGGGDPLAALARLIEQDEAFGAIVRSGRSQQRVPSHLVAREAARTGKPHGAHEDGADDVPDYSNGLPDQRRGLRVFAAVVGLALAGSASAMAYWAWSDGRTRGDTAPVTGASIGPDKIMPSPQESSRSDERLPGQPVERSVTART